MGSPVHSHTPHLLHILIWSGPNTLASTHFLSPFHSTVMTLKPCDQPLICLKYTHTHTHTHTHNNTQTHHTPRHPHTRHTHTHTHTHPHTHPHPHTLTHTHSPSHVHTERGCGMYSICKYIHMALTFTSASCLNYVFITIMGTASKELNHTYTHTHTCTYFTNVCMVFQQITYSHVRARTHTHTHTHTHTPKTHK